MSSTFYTKLDEETLNANYGNLISLRTEKAISKHAEKIIKDLFAECKEVVKKAMAGTTKAENYQSELAKIKLGLENRLSAYRESNLYKSKVRSQKSKVLLSLSLGEHSKSID